LIPYIFFHLMEFNLKLTAVIGMVAVLAIALAAGTVAHQQVNAVDCKGNPHDSDSGPTGNPHYEGEHGNPHDGAHQGGESDHCHGAQ
jgi:hypothetical protein